MSDVKYDKMVLGKEKPVESVIYQCFARLASQTDYDYIRYFIPKNSITPDMVNFWVECLNNWGLRCARIDMPSAGSYPVIFARQKSWTATLMIGTALRYLNEGFESVKALFEGREGKSWEDLFIAFQIFHCGSGVAEDGHSLWPSYSIRMKPRKILGLAEFRARFKKSLVEKSTSYNSIYTALNTDNLNFIYPPNRPTVNNGVKNALKYYSDFVLTGGEPPVKVVGAVKA